MTYADENQYPPSGPAGSPWSHTQPQWYGYDAPGHDWYGHATWDEPVAQARPHQDDLTALRSAYRLLRRISTLTALGSFVVYVVLSCSAPGLMGSKIAGELSLGMALGVLQLVVTFAAVHWYGRSARRSVDPLARVIRERTAPAGGNAGVAR
ncbi:DUF485 domain-containing protein [Streptomyces durhamensis]|nr:DUF485 domain-containing protein [Streptomyces durhamensis]